MNKSTKKPYPRHYGVIGSDNVVLAYPAAEVERYISEMEQRAEAAEAKLAELEKQQHVAEIVSKLRGLQRVKEIAWIGGSSQPVGARLYARPAPSINLADLVKDDEFRASFERWMIDDMKCVIGSSDPYPAGIEARNWNAWKACRAAILRNIEAMK